MKYLITLICLSFIIIVKSQTDQNSSLDPIQHQVFAELYGVSLLGTINYQVKLPIKKQSDMMVSIGFGHGPWFDRFEPFIPVRVLYNFDFGKHSFQSGINICSYIERYNKEHSNSGPEFNQMLDSETNYQYSFTEKIYAGVGVNLLLWDPNYGFGANGHLHFGYRL